MKGITPHPKANMKEFHLHVIVYHLTSRTSNLSNNSTFSHILELVCVCVCVLYRVPCIMPGVILMEGFFLSVITLCKETSYA